MMIIDSETKLIKVTPVERHTINGKLVYVKREDLCCPWPGPPFSKMRGVVRAIQSFKYNNVYNVGYAESSISMACWGLSWAASHHGVQVYAFMPKYKNGQPELLEFHRKMWESFGAKTIAIKKPTLGKINHNMAKSWLWNKFGSEAAMIPMGMPFQETIEETVLQVVWTDLSRIKTIVINVGSGTICAGILKGLKKAGLDRKIKVIGVSCRRYSLEAADRRIDYIFKRANLMRGGLLGKSQFEFISTDYEYTDKEMIKTPFPCNPYYDKKCWRWLIDHYDVIEKPVLYWNIGAGGEVMKK